jgi:PHP family Zn ribbon phosphoesterase
MKNPDEKNKILMTIEFFPEEGKYHYDGHRLCKIRFSPQESKKNNFFCPVCGKKVTIGVMSRVEELAKRPSDFSDPRRPPFKMTSPLLEILAQIYQTQPTTKKVWGKYLEITQKFGPELEILIGNYDKAKMKEEETLIFQALEKVDQEEVILEPGYDGEYGKVIIKLNGVETKEKRLF